MTAIFFLLTLILASLIGHGVKLNDQDRGVMQQLEAVSGSAGAAALNSPDVGGVTASETTESAAQ